MPRGSSSLPCRICGADLGTAGTYKGKVCKQCRKTASVALRRKNRSKGLCGCGRLPTSGRMCDSCKEKQKRAYQDDDVRVQVLAAYGGVCACCGELRPEFLTIDHIVPVGNQGPRHLRCGHGLYRWLRTRKYPEGFRVLCYNCNCARGHLGYCPHELEAQSRKILTKSTSQPRS